MEALIIGFEMVKQDLQMRLDDADRKAQSAAEFSERLEAKQRQLAQLENNLTIREWELAKEKRQHNQELQVKLNSLEQREEQLARRALQFEADTCRIYSALTKAENILAEHNAAVYPQEQPVATTSGVEESRCEAQDQAEHSSSRDSLSCYGHDACELSTMDETDEQDDLSHSTPDRKTKEDSSSDEYPWTREKIVYEIMPRRQIWSVLTETSMGESASEDTYPTSGSSTMSSEGRTSNVATSSETDIEWDLPDDVYRDDNYMDTSMEIRQQTQTVFTPDMAFKPIKRVAVLPTEEAAGQPKKKAKQFQTAENFG